MGIISTLTLEEGGTSGERSSHRSVTVFMWESVFAPWGSHDYVTQVIFIAVKPTERFISLL